MLRTGKNGRYRYYTCASQARKGKSECKGRSIRMDLLDALVVDHLTDRLLTTDRLADILEALLAQYAANQNTDLARLTSHKNAASEAEQKLQRLYAAIENGITDISDPTLKERIAALKAQRNEAKRLCDAAQAPAMVVPTITADMLDSFAADLRTKLKDGPIALRKAYLQAIIERIVVDDRKIEMIGQKDRLLSQLVKASPNAAKPRAKVLSFARHWRPRRDSNPCYRRERAVS